MNRVLVTGGAGFLGRRVVEVLRERGAEPVVVRSAEHDLTRSEDVRAVLDQTTPSMVVHCAATVGGIGANREHPAAFFYDNAAMGLHLIHEAWRTGVGKLLVVGTVCAYPKDTPVPFREDDIWSGYPEETNAPYGLAKRMLLAQGQAYRAEHGFNAIHVVPSNLYGPGDHSDLRTSHVIPAIIRKCLEAVRDGRDEVTLWGSGAATREFLHVDDAARGLIDALERYDEPAPLNLGTGREVAISELAAMIAGRTGFAGTFRWDAAQPDGQPRRAIDAGRARRLLGWEPRVPFEEGLAETVEWYRQRLPDLAQT